jgi:hypothetical protein
MAIANRVGYIATAGSVVLRRGYPEAFNILLIAVL